MKDYTKEIGFWKRLESFVSDVQTGCCAGEEEKEMIMHVCKLKILDLQNVNASFLPKCTRVEVIDHSGRAYVNWKHTNKVQTQMQDDNKTLKIFIS